VLPQIVVWAGAWLLLAAAMLMLLGHRQRPAHWLASLVAVGTSAGAAWAAQAALVERVLPLGAAAGVSLAAGVMVTAAWEDWTPVGHAGFSAVCVSTAAFLAYAVHAVVETRLGPWSLTFALVLLALQFGALALLVAHTLDGRSGSVWPRLVGNWMCDRRACGSGSGGWRSAPGRWWATCSRGV
jgi:hypothetical protein